GAGDRRVLPGGHRRGARGLFANLPQTGMEGAALLLVDDATPASFSRRDGVRPPAPAGRARLPGKLAGRRDGARRELCGAAAGVTMVSIALETPHQEAVLGLLAKSDAFAQALYPPESNHLIDTDALARPNVRFYVARLSGEAIGCGALVLGLDYQAELKRMFVNDEARGRGVG